MAEFNVTGLDDFFDMLLRQQEIAQKAAPEMLAAGGAVMKEALRNEVLQTFGSHRSTGDLAASITVSKVKEKDGAKLIEVYPTGKDRHGVSNATKGFVLQYGRSNMPARPWFTAAVTKATDSVNAEMRRVWEEMQDGR